MEKIFYLFEGFKVKSYVKKPLLFLHVRRTGGIFLSNVLARNIKKYTQIWGENESSSKLQNKKFLKERELFINKKFNTNTKYEESAFEYFLKNKKQILNSKSQFIFGHVPIDIKKFFPGFLTMVIIREPISMYISLINFYLEKGHIDLKNGLEYIFDKKIVKANMITKQFCELDIEKSMNDEKMLKASIKNLTTKVDILFDFKDIDKYTNYLISIYNFSNLLFQKNNPSKKIKTFSNKEIKIIKRYCHLDLKLYNYLKMRKKFKKIQFLKKRTEMNKYLYISKNLPFKNMKYFFFNRDQIPIIKSHLAKSGYIVKKFKRP